MRRRILHRLGGAVIQVLIVTLFAWLLFYVIARFTGASPAQRIAGKTATTAQIAQVAKLLGLDKPYWQQYLIFLGHLAARQLRVLLCPDATRSRTSCGRLSE